jgi:hypothetical protein
MYHLDTNMTFRIYLRWPGQKVTDKTVTESKEVAEVAYNELVNREYGKQQPLGVAFTEDGKQIRYHNFGDEQK